MKSSNLQIILMGIFLFFGVVGVIVFATLGGKDKGGNQSIPITIWGTLPGENINRSIEKMNLATQGGLSITYVEKSEDNFGNELSRAISEGAGPDAVIIPEYILLSEKKKLVEVPWTVFSERQFKDSFLEAGEIFLTDKGILAFPVFVDPMVLYWNRDLFSKAKIVEAPKYWDEFPSLVKGLSSVSQNKVVSNSSIALGEYSNIPHAKEILSMLMLQAGSPIVEMGEKEYYPAMKKSIYGDGIDPSTLSLQFFTQFANPSSDLYTWNRSILSADKSFLKGSSAMYLGFASELFSIQNKNPNLNFDVAIVPQSKSAPREVSYAHVYGFGILNSSKVIQTSLKNALTLSGVDFQKVLSNEFGLAPIRKDLLKILPGTASGDILWHSAIISKTWLDPDKIKTEASFKNMIESVTSGRVKADEATSYMARELGEMLK